MMAPRRRVTRSVQGAGLYDLEEHDGSAWKTIATALDGPTAVRRRDFPSLIPSSKTR